MSSGGAKKSSLFVPQILLSPGPQQRTTCLGNFRPLREVYEECLLIVNVQRTVRGTSEAEINATLMV